MTTVTTTCTQHAAASICPILAAADIAFHARRLVRQLACARHRVAPSSPMVLLPAGQAVQLFMLLLPTVLCPAGQALQLRAPCW